MNHRIIQVEDDTVILLDRIIGDGGETDPDWQVIISTYLDEEYRYDEWVNFDDLRIAQSFIKDFSERAAERFMERAKAAHEQRTRGLGFKLIGYWDVIRDKIRQGLSKSSPPPDGSG